MKSNLHIQPIFTLYPESLTLISHTLSTILYNKRSQVITAIISLEKQRSNYQKRKQVLWKLPNNFLH